MLRVIMLIVTMLCVIMLIVIMLRVIMLIVIMLNVIMLIVIMLSVIMLSVITLSVIILSVIMLSVVAPEGSTLQVPLGSVPVSTRKYKTDMKTNSGRNTLAYFFPLSVTKKSSFRTILPVCQCFKNFFGQKQSGQTNWNSLLWKA
jgi:hypothetical protein